MRRAGVKTLASNPAPKIPEAQFNRVEKAVSEFYSVGFAKTDIMPSDMSYTKYYVAGYRYKNPASGSLDPMTASAVWVDDQSGAGGVVFVSTDTIGLFDYDIRIIKDMLKDFVAETGCRAINIMSIHNHAAIDTMGLWGPLPKSGRNPNYMKIVYDGVVKVVKEAYADRREGSLFVGSKETPDIQRDSRLPNVFSNVLTRIRFVPNDGSREIFILNYASHTESLLGANSLVSADFAYYIRKYILEERGAETIYFVGAIGGLIRLKELDKDNIKSTEMGGRAIADTALAIEDERKLDARISFIRQEFYVDAENVALIYAAKYNIIKANKFATGAGSLGWSLRTEMSYYDIGGLKLLLLPGEIFPELVYGGYLSAEESGTGNGPEVNPLPLEEIAGEKLLVFGLSNDEIGYITTPNDFILNPDRPYLDRAVDSHGRTHYEETNGLGINTATIIAQTFEQMIKTVKESEKSALK